MPLIVDHAQRREQVVEIAVELIAQRGIEGVSVRAIAQQAGYSTAIVSHYFRNKAELLLMAYQQTLGNAGQRVEDAIAAHVPAQPALEHLLPLDEIGQRNWKIWFAFWGLALSDDKYRQEQIMRGREAQALIERVLAQCSDVPEEEAGGRTMQAGRLLAMIAGLATQATYDPEGWPPERQRAVLAAELAALTRQTQCRSG
ncbi:TetR/AcrR family transcriptional regulator [Sphingobium indicum]|uniref:TetR/AcrR family transcriptional regulator n=1 Tax=Sphingobium indicum TaxID=332055 RepID=UPI0006853E2A|nr:TetR/AcrR family transcriptional regulator [Sphingobium indicum]